MTSLDNLPIVMLSHSIMLYIKLYKIIILFIPHPLHSVKISMAMTALPHDPSSLLIKIHLIILSLPIYLIQLPIKSSKIHPIIAYNILMLSSLKMVQIIAYLPFLIQHLVVLLIQYPLFTIHQVF